MAQNPTAVLFPTAIKNIANGTIDWVGGTQAITLHSSSYTPSTAHEFASSLAGELPTQDGYTQGGITLTGKSIGLAGSISQLKSTLLVEWTAAATKTLTARYAVVRQVGANPGSSPLVCLIHLDPTPADVAWSDGNKLSLDWEDAVVVAVTAQSWS